MYYYFIFIAMITKLNLHSKKLPIFNSCEVSLKDSCVSETWNSTYFVHFFVLLNFKRKFSPANIKNPKVRSIKLILFLKNSQFLESLPFIKKLTFYLFFRIRTLKIRNIFAFRGVLNKFTF